MPPGRRTPTPRSRRSASARRVLGGADVRSRRCSSGGARRPCSRRATWCGSLSAIGARVRAGGRRRGDHRVQPGQLSTSPTSWRSGQAGSTGSRSACSPPCRTCCPCSTGRTTRSGCRRWSAGRGRPASTRSPGPDLRDARGVGRGLAGDARRGAGLRARPRLGVRADRRGRHRAGPAGPPRRGADAGRRRPGGQVPRRRRRARGGRARLVRGVQLGPRRRRARCRHNVGYWTGADWWGVGPGAHSHVGGVRWWNVKHPTRVRRADRRPGQSRAGPGGARRRDPACGAGAARDPAARRASRSTCSTPADAPRCRGWSSGGSSRRRRPRRAHHGAAGCSPTRVVRDLLP